MNHSIQVFFKSAALLALLAFSFAPTLARAQDDSGGDDNQGDQGVSFQTFYDQLNDQGTWVQTDDYGYVFQPTVSDPDWQPYSDGNWVDSDAGLTWVSDEPWGWATYHYGRWINIDGTGWVWVPGYRWAPAWVSWRYGGGYCGWAPLPPETLYGAEYDDPGASIAIGFHFGSDCDVRFHIGAGCYNFVRVEDMGERNYRGHYLNRNDNFAIINNTTNVTNINVDHGRTSGFRGVTAGGPPLADLNAHAREHIQTVQLTRANQPGKSTLQGNSLAVFAPRVNPATLHQARPATVSQSINHPTFNRGDSISKPFMVTRNIQAPAPTQDAIHAAEQAQAQAPANARIATPHTPVRTEPTRSFDSLAPVVTHNHPGNAPNVTTPGNPSNPSTFHPQQAPRPEAFTPAQASAPNSTYHPEHQNYNGGNPTYTPPPNTFHPQNPNNGENQQQPRTFEPQTQHAGSGGPGESQHFAPGSAVVHPPNPGGNGGGQAPHPPSGGGQGGNHPAPHPAPAPAQSSAPPAKTEDKKP